MKKWNKILSVGLSLVLCAGMVTPAFAATFNNLQEVIDSKNSYTYEKDGETVTGISYDNGTVTLHENVEHVSGDSKTITIKKDTDVTIDLNGNNIDGGSDYVITINAGGALTLEDSTGSGAITGSTNRGGVKNSGTFTMNNGTISGNTAKDGGGVYNFRGTFTMEDGTIEGNNAVYAGVGQGGGVYNDQTVFTMNGGTISGNTADTYGGGVKSSKGTLIMTGGTISGNTARSMGDEITCASVTELSFPKDSVWDSDGSSDRMYGVHEVYSGEELSSMDNSSVHLKHHEHDFTNEETTQPTCTEPGKVVYSGCSCGQTVEEPIKALGHDMGEWYTVKEAGPGVEGEERCDCNRCDYFETRPIPAEPVTNPDPVNPDPTNPTDPTSPTDPTVEVDEIGEADVPLADAPETADEAEEIDEADVSEEPVEIIDEELPLTEMPEIPEIPEETEIPEEPTAIVIEEDDVPLSDVPQTGEASTAMWLAVLLASGMGLVYLNTGKRKENA